MLCTYLQHPQILFGVILVNFPYLHTDLWLSLHSRTSKNIKSRFSGQQSACLGPERQMVWFQIEGSGLWRHFLNISNTAVTYLPWPAPSRSNFKLCGEKTHTQKREQTYLKRSYWYPRIKLILKDLYILHLLLCDLKTTLKEQMLPFPKCCRLLSEASIFFFFPFN